MSTIKENSKGFVKRVSEACPACLLNMVQGDLFAITLNHWIIAFKTGILTGIFWLISIMTPLKKLQENVLVLSLLAAVADFIIVPSHFFGMLGEAISTGITVFILSSIYSYVFERWTEFRASKK